MAYGNLFIVATPIGNLGDITLRALDTLKSVDAIICEDTRVTKKLLDHYGIVRPLISYHHHSDGKKIREIKNLLADGKNVALVTDAGTPGISDPGNMLINDIVHGSTTASIIPIPGASAAIAALSISGLPTDKFIFLGFPPHKKGRQGFLKTVAQSSYTVVFYESGHRIRKCIDELKSLLDPHRKVIVCRELTKKFESIYRGTIQQIPAETMDERGEFTIVIG